MAIHPDLRDVADLLGLSGREAAVFCSEVAWHVTDRPVTYALVAAVLDAHPRTDPTPEQVAAWIMATPAPADAEASAVAEAQEYVEMEYDPRKGKLNVIQRRDFRDAQAMFRKCPHGIPITQRCRICRPTD